MQGILYEEPLVWQFLVVSVAMGGWTAWRVGKSCAESWQGYRALVVYSLLLGVAVRFLHHALFHGTMLATRFYTIDSIIAFLFAFAGFRLHRTRLMTQSYYWLYERTSPFTLRVK